MTPFPDTLGVILAGGRSRRMGGADKTLLQLQGWTLLAHVVNRLRPQCESIILNANGDPSRFAEMNLPFVPDTVPDHPGPLAGLLAGMDWSISNKPSVKWIVSVPGDTPFIPANLVERLHAVRETARTAAAYATSGSQRHYATGLWPVSLRDHLRHALALEGMRRVEDWVNAHEPAVAVWPLEPIDPFFNINTPGDLRTAIAMVSHTPLRSSGLRQDGFRTQEDGNG